MSGVKLQDLAQGELSSLQSCAYRPGNVSALSRILVHPGFRAEILNVRMKQ